MRFCFLFLLVIALSACRKDVLIQHEADILKIENYLSQRGIVAQRDSNAGFFYHFYVENNQSYQLSRNEGLTLEVRYKAFLLDGTIVKDTGTETEKIALDESIHGWQLALPLMNKGERMLLILPSRLAYGATKTTLIPSNSILAFDIELLEIYPQF